MISRDAGQAGESCRGQDRGQQPARCAAAYAAGNQQPHGIGRGDRRRSSATCSRTLPHAWPTEARQTPTRSAIQRSADRTPSQVRASHRLGRGGSGTAIAWAGCNRANNSGLVSTSVKTARTASLTAAATASFSPSAKPSRIESRSIDLFGQALACPAVGQRSAHGNSPFTAVEIRFTGTPSDRKSLALSLVLLRLMADPRQSPGLA